jgi:signal transduction histidine kinase
MEDDGNMPRRMKGGRDIVVANTRGRIVAASNETMLGKQVDEDIKKSSAYPLETGDGNRIGTLYISSPLNMGISSLENTFVHNVTMQAIWTAAVVVFIALLLGLFLARRITSPLEELSSAIHKLAQGQLTARVKPRGDREFVSLGRDFNLMASKLMDQEIARRRLMSDIAHELRTPLTLLRGQLEAMQSGRLEFSEDIISSLVDETIRLTRLVKDLEAISLAESGNLPMTITEVNIKEVVEKLAPVRLAMEEQQINMAVLVDESIESIKVDLNRLLQILINLLSNAMRYSKAGDEIKLEINADKTGIIFSVSDMGPGIAPEHLPHLFDRFYRADESRSSISGGRGLGLSIARSYAEAHGGRIWVESELGAGTTFYVFIPQ